MPAAQFAKSNVRKNVDRDRKLRRWRSKLSR